MSEWIYDGDWHTTECQAEREVYRRFQAEYEAKWPNYCRACNGQGGHWSKYDPSPPGVSLGPGYMTELDPCPVCCYEKGACPRCGKEQTDDWFSEDVPCPDCGWDWYRHPDDALEPPECYCHHLSDHPERAESVYDFYAYFHGDSDE